ncbi:GNAT family N-acetyltransferase [Pseudarthrobacter sp. L19]|uniref:GNAT family N-acetyltransferase n=1 Tax=Pseudarthrobacter sp. L19 TaxID=3423951 RepID=UPI003D79D311
MPEFSLSASRDVSRSELLALYDSVGWTAYTNEPDVLERAVRKSSFVVTARADGALVGLARAMSDDETICYVQDILVHPSFHRSGVGRQLLAGVMDRFAHVRQTVLLTDDEPGQRAFYESQGFIEGGDSKPHTLRVFTLFR